MQEMKPMGPHERHVAIERQVKLDTMRLYEMMKTLDFQFRNLAT